MAAGPSQSGSSRQPVQAEYLSAAEEKALQRKRFEEAQNRVVSGSSQTANPSAPASPTKSSRASVHSNAADPSTTPDQSGPLSNAPQTPRTSGIGAINEKKQTRRYYEAQDRVARARDSFTPDRSVDGRASNGKASGSAAVPTSIPASTSGTALSEKEQMRRYYEAQDRVARAADGGAEGSSAPSTQQRSRSPEKSRTSIERSPPTALDEKEQMRRYYEAQDRVARVASGSPPPFDGTPQNQAGPSGSSSSPFTQASPGTPTPATGPSSRAGPSSGSSPLVNGSSSAPGYLSAGEEKEMMRKRFESAQEAVQRRMNSSPSPPPSQSYSASPSSHLPPEQAGYSGVSPLAKEVLARASTAKAQTARESTGADGPPPPLPVKPPMEYINLLSPVHETSNSFARWSAPTRHGGYQSSSFEQGIGIKMNGNGRPDGVGMSQERGSTSPVVLAKPLDGSATSGEQSA